MRITQNKSNTGLQEATGKQREVSQQASVRKKELWRSPREKNGVMEIWLLNRRAITSKEPYQGRKDNKEVGQVMRLSLTIKYKKAFKTQKLGQTIKVEHKTYHKHTGARCQTRQTQQNTQTKRSSAIHITFMPLKRKVC